MAILYNDASTFTVSTMESAEQYAKDLGLAPVVAAYHGTAYPAGRILPLLREVRRQGVAWLLCLKLCSELCAHIVVRKGGNATVLHTARCNGSTLSVCRTVGCPLPACLSHVGMKLVAQHTNPLQVAYRYNATVRAAGPVRQP